ncbi:MAG: phosphoribosylanthranilate isomerase, partial [Planctomycetota bacterium]
MRRFRIKICGISTIEDAMRAIESGADAIGLNFYEQSSRYVEAFTAMEISTAVHSAIATVGVFVNSPASDIAELTEHLQLSAVQLHGDEDPKIADALDGIDVVRAI